MPLPRAVPRAEGAPVELCRWWTGGFEDLLIVRDQNDVELQRIRVMDPRKPIAGQLVCRDRRSVLDITAVVKTWGPPRPTSCLLSVRLPLARTSRPSITEEQLFGRVPARERSS